MSRTQTVWKERDVDNLVVQELVIEHNVHRILARVMAGRGVTLDQAKSYLSPKLEDLIDPNLLKGVPKATHRLVEAIANGETIGIFGDYDVDGVTSTTLLSEFLEQLGVSVIATIPDRLKEGYGLSKAGVDRLRAQGASIIVTVDCGITAHEEVDYAAACGLDVIVVDHHTVPVELPKACAVINPHRPDCPQRAHHLCAVGVVFNLCIALRKELREQGFFASTKEPNLAQLLDLVAIGTVADVVPLVQDNRIFVQHGLNAIMKSRRPGIKALLDVAEIEPKKVTAGTLGFHIGPRINAAGRLEDAMQAVQLLREREYFKAKEIARLLNDINSSRRELEQLALVEAIQQIDNSFEHQAAKVLVVANPKWHPGVVGIVASRLVDKYGKPAIVIGQNGKGSGRSIFKFHLHDALVAIKDTLVGFGGHGHAVGVQVDLSNLDEFRRALVAHADKLLTADDMFRVVEYDGEISVHDICDELVELLVQAAPFGRSNPEPVFRLNQVRVENIRELKGGHIKAQVAGRPSVSLIAFGMLEKRPLLEGTIDILATPEWNEWQGVKSLQLRVKDIAASP